jgi:1-deoxy-D-xylulose-5-phosphate synthase
MSPKDEDELADMMFSATHQRQPVFIRYPRGPAEGVPVKEQPQIIEIGKAEVIQNFSGGGGRKIALFGLGNMLSMARKVAQELAASGHDTAIINPRFTKPLDTGTTEFFSRAADLVVTFEDHVLNGGYGSSVLELLNESRIPAPVLRVGWPDKFIEHASTVDYLREKHGLTVAATLARVKSHFSESSRALPLANATA